MLSDFFAFSIITRNLFASTLKPQCAESHWPELLSPEKFSILWEGSTQYRLLLKLKRPEALSFNLVNCGARVSN